ncbi:hypothetical protein FXO37_30927 [Capsicum annuum]|nr:hypothetical protein FXO37_30927 [Capsicum annuum]
MENGKASDLPQAADNADRMRDKEMNCLTRLILKKKMMRADPDWSVKGLIAVVLKDCSYTILYKKAWRAKKIALKWVHGEEGLQYGQLLSYRAELLNSNPGSTVVIWRDGEKFQGGPKFRVIGPGGPYVVDLVDKSFTCRRFDLIGLPCTHAYVSIIGNNEKIEKYVNVFYHVDTFKSVYSHYINPTNHEDHWPKVVDCAEILPPKILNGLGGRGADYETSLHVTELPARPSVLKSGEHLKRKSIPNDVITAQNKSAA